MKTAAIECRCSIRRFYSESSLDLRNLASSWLLGLRETSRTGISTFPDLALWLKSGIGAQLTDAMYSSPFTYSSGSSAGGTGCEAKTTPSDQVSSIGWPIFIRTVKALTSCWALSYLTISRMIIRFKGSCVISTNGRFHRVERLGLGARLLGFFRRPRNPFILG